MPGLADHFRNVLIGGAVGDALGLPREGLSRRRAGRLFGNPPLRHRLILGRGMISDDIEHACMVAQALLASGGEPNAFAASLAWRLRFWFAALPAGVGMATAKACIKLWLGFSPQHSGVWSAGNGPAMRAAILGAYAWNDLPQLASLVAGSTQLTHRDPAAQHGAMAIALAAALAVRCGQENRSVDAGEYVALAGAYLASTPMLSLIEDAVQKARAGLTLQEYLESRGLGRGISGYVNHTAPACLFAWLASPTDFRSALEQVIVAGGDADSTGAIVGALAGLSAGRQSIPREWVSGIVEWPRSVRWIEGLANRLADDCEAPVKSRRAAAMFWPGVLPRNMGFLVIVFAHGLRRLLPPY